MLAGVLLAVYQTDWQWCEWRASPHPSPPETSDRPEGEGADRGVFRVTSTCKTSAIMALVSFSDSGFNEPRSGRRNPRISPNRFPLLGERARVRGGPSAATMSPASPHDASAHLLQINSNHDPTSNRFPPTPGNCPRVCTWQAAQRAKARVPLRRFVHAAPRMSLQLQPDTAHAH